MEDTMDGFVQQESLRPPPFPADSTIHRILPGHVTGDTRLDGLSHIQLASHMGYHRRRVEASLHNTADPPPSEDEAVRAAMLPDPEPSWADKEALKRGQAVYADHLLVYTGALFALLVHGFAINRFSEVLIQAGYAKTPWATHVRFRDTGAAVHLWMTHDITDPNSAARRSLLQVRWMHAFARNLVQLPGGLWEREEGIERARLSRLGVTIDPNKSHIGVPLSQYDLAMTLLGFSSIALSYMIDDFHSDLTPQNKDDLIHLWRYIGYHIGIHDAFNPCCSTAQAEQMAQDMFSFTRPFAAGARRSTPQLSQSLLMGFGRHTGVPKAILDALPVIVGENRCWSLKVLTGRDDAVFPHSRPAKLLLRLLHWLLPRKPWLRVFLNAILRRAMWWMCYYPRLSIFVEGYVLPFISRPGEFLFWLSEIVYRVIFLH